MRSISAMSFGPSTKARSAPASISALARQIASSSEPPWAPRLSVRAISTNSGSSAWRVAWAARILPTASVRSTTSRPATWPQRLGATWSSRCMPPSPLRMYSSTVRTTLMALPKPVSASAITGTLTAAAMRRAFIAVSVRVDRPASGRPSRASDEP